jgi:hypothetical protein
MGEITLGCCHHQTDILSAVDSTNKLQFCREQSPAEFDAAKKVFLKAVCQFLVADCIVLIFFTAYKVCLYGDTNDTTTAGSAIPGQAAIPKPSKPSAADILHLN